MWWCFDVSAKQIVDNELIQTNKTANAKEWNDCSNNIINNHLMNGWMMTNNGFILNELMMVGWIMEYASLISC
jgi:hypothetical protein